MGTMPRPTRLVLEAALYSALLLAFPLHGSANAQSPDTLPPDPVRDAYLDETARRLMQGVRAARDTARLAVDSYTALTRERIRTELPTLRRDRLWMHGERVARVRWSREEPNVVHLLASRVRYPGPGPDDIPDFFPGLENRVLRGRPAVGSLWQPFVRQGPDRRRHRRAQPAGDGFGAVLPVPLGGYGHGAAGGRPNGRGRCGHRDSAVPQHPPRRREAVD